MLNTLLTILFHKTCTLYPIPPWFSPLISGFHELTYDISYVLNKNYHCKFTIALNYWECNIASMPDVAREGLDCKNCSHSLAVNKSQAKTFTRSLHVPGLYQFLGIFFHDSLLYSWVLLVYVYNVLIEETQSVNFYSSFLITGHCLPCIPYSLFKMDTGYWEPPSRALA